MSDRNFANREQIVAAAKRAHGVVLELRGQADTEITKPATGRKPEVVSKWAPTITASIVASQNLRVAAAMDEDNVQALLSNLQNLKHFVWIMSEYLGRERAVVAGMIAAGRPMSAQEISTLGTFRGRVEAAWDYVQAYAAKSSAPPSVRAETDRMREKVFRASRIRARRSTPRDWRRNLSDQFCRMVQPVNRGDRRSDRVERAGKSGSRAAGRDSPAQQFADADAQWLPDGLLAYSCGAHALDGDKPRRALARSDNGGHGQACRRRDIGRRSLHTTSG